MKSKAGIIKTLKTTPIVQIACQQAKISRATYYRWRKEDSNFKKRTSIALKNGVHFINDLAQSNLISLIKDKHPTSIFYWLNHKHPDYAEKRLLLSISEQKQLLNYIFSQDEESAVRFVIEKNIQGKLNNNYSTKDLSKMIEQYKESRENDYNLKY